MDSDLEWYFGWLAEELKNKKEHCERTVIYCQTIKQCGIIYGVLKGMLGQDLIIRTDTGEQHPLLEMLHSCTPDQNKNNIISSFQSEKGTVRLLVATIAFGMDVDCKGVCRVIHYGPSKNVETFVQETGRAGRDGSQSTSYLLYQGMLLNHVDGDIKCFIRNTKCTRKTLLNYFQSDCEKPDIAHLSILLLPTARLQNACKISNAQRGRKDTKVLSIERSTDASKTTSGRTAD
ncbi:probable Werner syndrome ATP-dependent helicase homolog 1 [Exaiptasia diaphana]|uniref:DNA 3'-5' helicase n=1 Tax=Exaiptasia diaphana TaxID=2652724 RepID=A0A913XLR1_EXADI|nr:probable Werner syndrome ATP-dependent helicase homolog 1 [Exaiptasia diaphana]